MDLSYMIHFCSKSSILRIFNFLQVYDQIADHFSSTRHSAWPRVKRFLDAIPVGSLVLDLGCGNGKYLFEQASIFKVSVPSLIGAF